MGQETGRGREGAGDGVVTRAEERTGRPHGAQVEKIDELRSANRRARVSGRDTGWQLAPWRRDDQQRTASSCGFNVAVVAAALCANGRRQLAAWTRKQTETDRRCYAAFLTEHIRVHSEREGRGNRAHFMLLVCGLPGLPNPARWRAGLELKHDSTLCTSSSSRPGRGGRCQPQDHPHSRNGGSARACIDVLMSVRTGPVPSASAI